MKKQTLPSNYGTQLDNKDFEQLYTTTLIYRKQLV